MSWSTTVFNFLAKARFNTITPSLQNGDLCEVQMDANGRLLVSTQPVNTSWSDGGPAVAEKVIKGSAGKVHQIFGRNTGASDRFIFIFNHAAGGVSRPANGSTAALFVPVKVKAGEAFSIDLPRARAFSVGLYFAISSTDATLTYDSTGTFVVAAEYE